MNCFSDPEERRCRERSREINRQLRQERKEFMLQRRLLLLGLSESGKATFIKQMKILHGDGFLKKERLQSAHDIRSNVREVIQSVTSQMPKLDPPITIKDQRNELRLSYIQNVITPLPEYETKFSPEFYEHAEALWNDEGVQEAYRRSNEYQLIDCAPYFMETSKLREVANPDYLPSDNDILQAHRRARGMYESFFKVDGVDFHVFNVGRQRGSRYKWIHFLGSITAIIYVVDTSSFNMVIREDNRTNQLKESLNLFEQIWNDRWLQNVSVILFLNKMDKLNEKIEGNQFHLEDYFPEFSSYKPPQDAVEKREQGDTELFLKARFFIRDQFLRIISQGANDGHHFCYPFFTTVVDTENFRRVFEACRSVVLDIIQH